MSGEANIVQMKLTELPIYVRLFFSTDWRIDLINTVPQILDLKIDLYMRLTNYAKSDFSSSPY